MLTFQKDLSQFTLWLGLTCISLALLAPASWDLLFVLWLIFWWSVNLGSPLHPDLVASACKIEKKKTKLPWPYRFNFTNFEIHRHPFFVSQKSRNGSFCAYFGVSTVSSKSAYCKAQFWKKEKTDIMTSRRTSTKEILLLDLRHSKSLSSVGTSLPLIFVFGCCVRERAANRWQQEFLFSFLVGWYKKTRLELSMDSATISFRQRYPKKDQPQISFSFWLSHIWHLSCFSTVQQLLFTFQRFSSSFPFNFFPLIVQSFVERAKSFAEFGRTKVGSLCLGLYFLFQKHWLAVMLGLIFHSWQLHKYTVLVCFWLGSICVWNIYKSGSEHTHAQEIWEFEIRLTICKIVMPVFLCQTLEDRSVCLFVLCSRRQHLFALQTPEIQWMCFRWLFMEVVSAIRTGRSDTIDNLIKTLFAFHSFKLDRYNPSMVCLTPFLLHPGGNLLVFALKNSLKTTLAFNTAAFWTKTIASRKERTVDEAHCCDTSRSLRILIGRQRARVQTRTFEATLVQIRDFPQNQLGTQKTPQDKAHDQSSGDYSIANKPSPVEAKRLHFLVLYRGSTEPMQRCKTSCGTPCCQIFSPKIEPANQKSGDNVVFLWFQVVSAKSFPEHKQCFHVGTPQQVIERAGSDNNGSKLLFQVKGAAWNPQMQKCVSESCRRFRTNILGQPGLLSLHLSKRNSNVAPDRSFARHQDQIRRWFVNFNKSYQQNVERLRYLLWKPFSWTVRFPKRLDCPAYGHPARSPACLVLLTQLTRQTANCQRIEQRMEKYQFWSPLLATEQAKASLSLTDHASGFCFTFTSAGTETTRQWQWSWVNGFGWGRRV